jgi:ABC-2 type transport system permease protein
MHRILLVAKRDYLASIRAKAFLVGLIVAPILFGGSFIGLGIMKRKPDVKDRPIVIVDRTGKAAAAVIQAAREKSAKGLYEKETGRQIAPRYLVTEIAPDNANPSAQRLALSDRVRSRQLYAFLEIGPGALHPPTDEEAAKRRENRVDYYANAAGVDEMRGWIASPVSDALRRVRLAELGVDAARFDGILAQATFQSMTLLSRDEKTGAIRDAQKKSGMEGFAVPFAMTMLLAMIVIASASPMLGAIADDKMQRVYEMLLASATPFELVAGKVLAAVALSLTSSAFYIVGSLLVLEGMAMTGLAPLALLPWFFVYLIADVMVLSALAAALGAACSSPHDAQQLAVLQLAPVLLPLFLMMPVITQPNGTVATALSLIPPFTPLLMLLRQATPGGIPAWQPWAGLAGVVCWTVAVSWIAARIFRVAILMQGKAPRPQELLRWALRG